MWVNNRVASELILLASSHVDNLNSIIHTGCAPSRSIGSQCWQLKEQAKNMLTKYGALKAKPIQIEACLTQLRQERTDLQAVLEAKQSNRAWRDKVKVVLASAVEQAGCPGSCVRETSEFVSHGIVAQISLVYIQLVNQCRLNQPESGWRTEYAADGTCLYWCTSTLTKSLVASQSMAE